MKHDWKPDPEVFSRWECQQCGLIKRVIYGDAEHEKTPREYYFWADDITTRQGGLIREAEGYVDDCGDMAMRKVLGQ